MSVLHIPIEHADDINTRNSSRCCELSNPESLECIHNSAVHDKAFTMCFIRKYTRKRLNLLTDSKEKRRVLLLLMSSPRSVRAMA